MIKARWTELLWSFVIPSIAALLFCSGWVLRMEYNLARSEDNIEKVNRRVDIIMNIGPDGAVDPEWHGKLDQHIRHVTLTREQFDAWKKLLHRLNPTLVPANGE
jgi:NADH:ubiquinone oxidoreductase subunit